MDGALKKFVVIALLSLSIAQQAKAAEPTGEEPVVAAQKKYYLGAKTGTIKNSFHTLSGNSIAYGLIGGYLVGPDFALELGYSNLGALESVIKFSALEFSAIAFFPITARFTLVGKLGIAKTTKSAFGYKPSRLGPTYGIGGKTDINQTISLRLGWDHYVYEGGLLKAEGDLFSVVGTIKF